MRVALWEWQLANLGWFRVGEMHLDQVAERLNEPMMSVAWDRDYLNLVPQPQVCSVIAKSRGSGNIMVLYGPTERNPPRIFVLRYTSGICLSYVDGVWAWRSNPGQRLLQYRDGSWAQVSQVVPSPPSTLITTI